MEDAADVEAALDDLEDQMRAATTVQSHFRGHQARKAVAKERAEPGGGAALVVLESHTDADEEHSAAAIVQASYRGHKSRRETKKMVEEENAAATKLQSGFRGYQSRKVTRVMVEEETAATTKVQAGFRGHQTGSVSPRCEVVTKGDAFEGGEGVVVVAGGEGGCARARRRSLRRRFETNTRSESRSNRAARDRGLSIPTLSSPRCSGRTRATRGLFGSILVRASLGRVLSVHLPS